MVQMKVRIEGVMKYMEAEGRKGWLLIGIQYDTVLDLYYNGLHSDVVDSVNSHRQLLEANYKQCQWPGSISPQIPSSLPLVRQKDPNLSKHCPAKSEPISERLMFSGSASELILHLTGPTLIINYLLSRFMSYKPIDSDNQYPVYPQRFLVTGLFGCIQMMTSVLMNTVNPIASDLSIIYDESPIVVNLSGLIFILMHPLFTFPAAYVIDSKGIKAGILVGSVLGILGISTRLLVNAAGFWTVIVGQVLAGIGRPFILNCQAKISATWFRASQRAGITQILTLIVNVSLIIGILIPGVVFGGYHVDQTSQQSIDQGRSLTFKLMLVEAILGYACFVPNMLFMKQRPPQPPSQSGYLPREPFAQAMKTVFRQRDFMFLLTAFGLYFGVFNAISITLAFMLEPWFGVNSTAVAIVGGSPVISGIIGVIVLAPMQKKSGVFKKWIVLCMLGSCSAMILFYPLLETNQVPVAALVSAYNSFFLIPLVPIMLELGCELAYPVGEGTAVGLLFAVGNLFGFIFGVIMSTFIKGETKGQTAAGLGFCLALFIIGFVLIYFTRQNLKRVKAEAQSSSKRFSSNPIAISEDQGQQGQKGKKELLSSKQNSAQNSEQGQYKPPDISNLSL